MGTFLFKLSFYTQRTVKYSSVGFRIVKLTTFLSSFTAIHNIMELPGTNNDHAINTVLPADTAGNERKTYIIDFQLKLRCQ